MAKKKGKKKGTFTDTWRISLSRRHHPDAEPESWRLFKYNKLVEETLPQFGGTKALYSDNCFSEEKFWNMFGKENYQTLKSNYDPRSVFPGLFEKMCNR